MTSENPSPTALEFVEGPLAAFIEGQYDLLARLTNEQYAPWLVEAGAIGGIVHSVYWQHMVHREALAAVSQLIVKHDLVPKLKEMSACQRQRLGYHKDVGLESFFFSGVGRLVLLVASGTTRAEALREVLDAYASVMIRGSFSLQLGATFRLNDLPSEGISLAGNLAVRRLTEEEFFDLAYPEKLRGMPRSPQAKEDFPPAVVLDSAGESVGQYAGTIPLLSEDLMKRLLGAVGFLQLELGDELLPFRCFAAPREWLPSTFGNIRRTGSHVQINYEPSYWCTPLEARIGPENIRHLRDLWPKYEQCLKNPRFSLAASRLSRSIQRNSTEDSIIDHWIALDSLFGRRENAMGRRIAQRLATFLQCPEKERPLLEDVVRKHYGIRGELVHGRKGLDRSVEQFHEAIQKVLPDRFPRDLGGAAQFSRHWLEQSLRMLLSDITLLDKLAGAE